MSTLRTAIASAALSAAALTAPVEAQQHTANVQAERLENGQHTLRTELYKGPLAVFRADRLGDGTFRTGLKLPVGPGFVQAFSEQKTDVHGYALHSELGSERFRVGTMLRTRDAHGERTNFARSYVLASNDVLTGAAGLGTIGGVHIVSAVGYAKTPAWGGSLGFVDREGRDLRVHGSLGKYKGNYGFILLGKHEGKQTTLDLIVSDGPNYPWIATVGPNLAYDAFHDVPLVSDIMTIPILPGVPPHIRTTKNGIVRVQYKRNGAQENLPIEARVFPGRMLGSQNGVARRVMVGYSHDALTGVDKAITELHVPIGTKGSLGRLVFYGEKAQGSKPYLFLGHYVPVGGSK